ncbi:hypothetical protein [Polyangium sorediatum]|uniref:Uncharacterized protein n=1 Tax=Polyangium sorediatum TaxID=889274 RepID=A0ABT6P7F4_9BACT|nr:hypothetical protein [Polyangium sorediatum]MDI1436549.1 hypothetical protein [Polyangium sorediatum]
MNTLRSITGLFAMASLFAFAAGCSVSEGERVGQSEQSLAEPPCECPSVVGSASNIVAPPCECEPPPEEPPVEEPPVEEPPSDDPCPPGEHEECSVKAPGGVQSIIAPPECVCVPDEEPPCPPNAVEVTTCGGILAPKGTVSIWGGNGGSCVTQCVLPH